VGRVDAARDQRGVPDRFEAGSEFDGDARAYGQRGQQLVGFGDVGAAQRGTFRR
jgi:hypothetical protein